MSEQIREDLFDLIKSMSMSEKRHFKIFASKHVIGEENYYVKLFDAMDKMKKYDEDKIKNTQDYTLRISLLKNRLYHIVIKSLNAYYHNSTIEAELLSYIHSIEILFNRSLFAQVQKMLNKAIALAEKYDEDAFMLILLEWNLKYIISRNYTGLSENDMAEFFQRINYIIKRHANAVDYSKLSTDLFYKIKQSGAIRDGASYDAFKKILQNPLLQSPEKALSFHSLFNYYRSLNAYYFMTDDHQKAYDYMKALYDLMHKNPHFIEHYLMQYKTVLSNLISCEMDVKKFNDALAHINEFRGLKISSQLWEVEKFYVSGLFELGMYITQGDFHKANNYVEKNKETIIGREEDPSLNEPRMILQYLAAYSYFANGKYSLALRTVNRILHLPDKGHRSDVLGFARILHLIICYEKQDEELIEYAFKSVYRYLSKKGQLYKFETAILLFVRKMPKLTSEKLVNEAFRSLKKEIEALLKDPMEKRVLTYFDFIAWLESKIENKPFAKMVKGN